MESNTNIIPTQITPNNLEYTFTIHVRISKGNNENTECTRLQGIHLILQAYQATESETKIVLPESIDNQRLTFNTIDTNRNTNANYQRLEKCLKFVNTDTIEGNSMTTSNSPYHMIEKNRDTK
jgi:hypothetical protein